MEASTLLERNMSQLSNARNVRRKEPETPVASGKVLCGTGRMITVDRYADGTVSFWRDDRGVLCELAMGDLLPIIQGDIVVKRESVCKQPEGDAQNPLARMLDHDAPVPKRVRFNGTAWLADLRDKSGVVTYRYKTRQQARKAELSHRVGDTSGRIE